MEQRGFFVGVGVDRYAADALGDLKHAVADVRALRDALDAELVGEPLLDPDEDTARKLLKKVKGALRDGGVLVCAWAGHAQPSTNGGLRLYVADSDPDDNDGSPRETSPAFAPGPGASQPLLILGRLLLRAQPRVDHG